MLSRNEHVFEVGYDTTGAVVDHSELYLSDLPGASEFDSLVRMLQRNERADAARHIQARAELVPLVRRWAPSPTVDESFTFEGARYQLVWRLPESGTAILFLSQNGTPSLGVLLLSGIERAEEVGLLGPDELAEIAFVGMLTECLGDAPFARSAALKLVRLTRRPLVATVFWPPRAAEDSDVRTLQRMLAFQFFAAHGVILTKPSSI